MIFDFCFYLFKSATDEKEQDQSTQSLDLGFPDDDDDGPQPEGILHKYKNIHIK